MPSIPPIDAPGVFLLIPMIECAFDLATFVLRSTWANRHNSIQGFNLEELANQSKLACGLASTKETRHGLNHTKDHVQEWKDLKVHEKVAT
jgi:hypothetical protein